MHRFDSGRRLHSSASVFCSVRRRTQGAKGEVCKTFIGGSSPPGAFPTMSDKSSDSAAPPRTTSGTPPPLSLVAACDARDCLYNRAAACTAGAVTIAVVNGRAVCATHTPRPTE